MESALAAIQFLANSPNRVQVFTALRDGPASRRDLQTATDGARSTVARILDDGEARGWVDAEGTRYRLTPLGEAMIAEFRSFLATIEGIEGLGELVNHVPPPLFSLDFRHLRDAEVVELTSANPAAPFTRSLELFRAATEYRGLNNTSLPRHAQALRERRERGNLAFEQVLERDFVETLRNHPERATVWADLADDVWVVDGTVPINLHVVDDAVLVWLGATRDEVAGLLESENEAVVEWAESLVADYRAEAEPLEGL